MNKLAGYFHLARKAGQLLMGQKAVMERAKKGDCNLIVLTSDAGSALERKLVRFKTVKISWSSDALGEVFDRERISVIGVTNTGLAAKIEDLIESEKLNAVR